VVGYGTSSEADTVMDKALKHCLNVAEYTHTTLKYLAEIIRSSLVMM
jgi:hypothetical protein